MKELWEQAILPYNLPLTIALGVVLVFWLISLLGMVGIDAFDLDVPDIEGSPGNIGDVAGAMLRFVNVGFVPVTVVLSVLILAMWTVSVTANYYLNPHQSGMMALGMIAGAFVVGVVVTKLVTQPLVPFMKKLKEEEEVKPVIGESGTVRSIEIDSRFGQVEVIRPSGAPAILNARLPEGAEILPRGAEVMVVSFDPASNLYVVHPLPPSPDLIS